MWSSTYSPGISFMCKLLCHNSSQRMCSRCTDFSKQHKKIICLKTSIIDHFIITCFCFFVLITVKHRLFTLLLSFLEKTFIFHFLQTQTFLLFPLVFIYRSRSYTPVKKFCSNTCIAVLSQSDIVFLTSHWWQLSVVTGENMVPESQVQVQETGQREGNGWTESTQPGKKRS